MTIVRAYAPESDADAIAALVSEIWRRPTPVDDILEHARTAPPERISTQLVAVVEGTAVDDAADGDATDGETVVAYANAIHDPANEPGYFHVDVVVTAAHRRHGLGTRLLTQVEQFAADHGATRLGGVIPGPEEDAGTAFAGRHGYAVERRAYQSFLKVADVDLELLATPDPPGLAVTTVAALGEPGRRTLWDLHERTAPDMPGARIATRRPYPEFEQAVLARRWFRDDGAFVATVDGAPAGLAIVGFYPETNSLNHTFTGVLAEFRGRGVASALKRATIRFARTIGADFLRAGNDTANAPMLAINERYGYRRSGGHVRVGKSRRPR